MAFNLFRTRGEPSGAPSAPAPGLADLAWGVHRDVDARYPELGPFATVLAKRVLDGVRAVLDQAGGEDRLELRAKLNLGRILEDYLPTTLRTFGRVRTNPVARAEVEQQLIHLARAVEETLTAVRSNNLRDLQVQGDFLDTKFTGSDLDL